MKLLRLAHDLALPVDAATQTFLNVGKRGSGKSTTAARLVEQLLKAGVPVAVLDPVDTWYGLKSSRDGAGAGHDVYVFGGRHADLPLEPGGGALIADVLCEHRVPMVLSCKHLSGRARGQFMADFATTLFQKWQGGVLHLVLEEAHELAPQQPQSGEEQMLGAFKRLWKLARSSGIGGTAITQRPASLHKDITTQAEILIVHRTIGPQDVAAVREWIRYHQQGEDILPELSKLKTGEAFVWAPEFPEDAPIGLKRVQMLPRETFDSAETPKHGKQRAEPKTLAAVDLERLRTKMAATIERAKAEDPKELRARIRQLEQEVRKNAEAWAKADVATKRIDSSLDRVKAQKPREVAVLKDSQIKRLEAQVHSLAVLLEAGANRMDKLGQGIGRTRDEILAALRQARREGEPVARDTQRGAAGRTLAADGRPRAAIPHSAPAPVVPRAPRESGGNGDGRLTPARRRILDALAWLFSVGIERANKTQLALLADASPTSSSYANNLGGLRSNGLIEYESGDVVLTGEGKGHAVEPETPWTSEEIQRAIMGKVSPAKARILKALIAAHPGSLTREVLAGQSGQSATSSSYANNLGSLRSLGIIDYRGGEVVAKELLFLEGA